MQTGSCFTCTKHFTLLLTFNWLKKGLCLVQKNVCVFKNAKAAKYVLFTTEKLFLSMHGSVLPVSSPACFNISHLPLFPVMDPCCCWWERVEGKKRKHKQQISGILQCIRSWELELMLFKWWNGSPKGPQLRSTQLVTTRSSTSRRREEVINTLGSTRIITFLCSFFFFSSGQP